ncbi:MAG: 50S ribosomal protein L5, partial [Candidatus Micrarchaeota archaeon]
SIEKVTLNIGAGAPGDKLEKAKKLLEKIAGQKAVETKTNKRIPTWDVKKGSAIGTKVTIRDKGKIKDLLVKCFEANDNKLKDSSFDMNGNFSFGVKDYIDVPGMKYDPEIGMFGFDVCITMKKWGYRVSKRKQRTAKIPAKHIIKKAESAEFIKNMFKVEIE